jgi:hypothetical protein
MAPGTEVHMWLAKIFNPQLNFNNPTLFPPYVMDTNISVSIFERNAAGAIVKRIHDDYYNVFIDTREDPFLHDALHPYTGQLW